jgi:CDP-glucose 4,6-dehydratase
MSHSFSDFYRGKRVLVTGHTGFEGGWAVAWLKLLGAQVCGYGLPPATRPNFFDATVLDRGMTSIFGDIRDRNSLANTFTELQPEIVIHCAQISPSRSHREPVDAFSTNMMGTVHILEEARLTASVRAMVLASRACGDRQTRATHDVEGCELYRASMDSAEIARSAFNKSFFQKTKVAVATARIADAIGGGDWRQGRIVPDLVRRLTSAEPVAPKQEKQRGLRIWHVLEPVRACLLLAQNLFERGQKSAGIWDFAPGDHDRISPSDFYEKFIALWNQPDAAQQGSAVKNPTSVQPHPQKPKTEPMGWSGALSPDQALAWTVEWYRGFCTEPASSLQTTQKQIEGYMRLSAQALLIT